MLLLLSSGCALSPSSSRDTLVEVRVDDETVCLGTVVHLDEGSLWVLTARHCVLFAAETEGRGEVERISVQTNGGRSHPVRALEVLPDDDPVVGGASDLALLSVSASAPGSASESMSERIVTARETVLGVSDDTWVSGVARRVAAGLLYTSVPLCPGDSGGPLFDAEGALVGVASWSTGTYCGGGTGVYVAVAPHVPWLRRTMR